MRHITTYIKDQLQSLYPPEEIRSFVRLILTSVCGLSYHQQIPGKDIKIPLNEKEQIFKIVTRLKKMEPVQYILGETEFYSIPLKINPSVLIPRPETEELVDMIIKSDDVKTCLKRSPFRILDVGTGSGCIAIALAKHIPDVSVTAIDISDQALQTAGQNAQSNNVSIRFNNSDILNTEQAVSQIPKKFDLIVSNPPYVKDDEKASMSANVLEYEPPVALFVPNTKPIVFYEAIARFAQQKLKSRGMIFFEINPLCSALIIDMLHNEGFSQAKVIRDLSGKNRFISVSKFPIII
jgi:release factor glutamine methyltransferase